MFERFIEEGKIKNTTPNINLQNSLISDANKRFDNYFKLKDNLDMAKFVFENFYESLRELSDAILDKKGYKSYSHEANILFLKEEEIITESEANIFDKMRKLRNKSKYYAGEISKEKLDEQINNFIKIKEKLLKFLE